MRVRSAVNVDRCVCLSGQLRGSGEQFFGWGSGICSVDPQIDLLLKATISSLMNEAGGGSCPAASVL